ncbi:hypothetical protein F5883DRAFT_547179 [Diaporthe sp. PMI_573]|nr:hypothetical protein F5883DRAFT_547179 [Diaporthaceae sp. PMI_573]
MSLVPSYLFLRRALLSSTVVSCFFSSPACRLVWSRFDPSDSSSVNVSVYSVQYVPFLARVPTYLHARMQYSRAQDRQFDPSRAGMLPPPWVRQPTWALTCLGVAQAHHLHLLSSG